VQTDRTKKVKQGAPKINHLEYPQYTHHHAPAKFQSFKGFSFSKTI